MFRLALATLAMIPPARTTRKRGLEAQQSEALSPPPKRSRTSIITTTTDLSPTRSRRRASPFMEARAWRRDQNRRQGERCLRKALSRHARALLQQKRAEMEGWLAATKAAEARVAQWRKEEEEDEQLLQMEEAYQQAARLQVRRDKEHEAERRAAERAEREAKARAEKERAEKEAKARAEEERAHQEAERKARERAHQEAEREERERAHQEARREAEAKRTAEATAKIAAEAEAKRAERERAHQEAKRVKEEEEERETEDRDKRMGDRQRAAREQQGQEAAGLREPASLRFVTTHKHAANRPREEARQRQLRGSALASLSATRINAKDRSAAPRSGGRTGPMPSPYCRPKRTSDPFSTGAPGHLPRGRVLAPLTTRSDVCAVVKRHLFGGVQTTQRTQQQHGALPLQQGMSAHSAAVLSSLRQGRPSSAVTPRRADRLAPKSRKMGEEIESLTEAMRKL